MEMKCLVCDTEMVNKQTTVLQEPKVDFKTKEKWFSYDHTNLVQVWVCPNCQEVRLKAPID